MKDKKKAKLYLQIEIISYKKRLKQYLENSYFDRNELEFIQIEIQRIEREIDQNDEGLMNVLSRGSKEEIEGAEKDPGLLNYIDFWQGHESAYLVWLKERKAALEKPYQNIKCLPWRGSKDQLKRLFKGLKEGKYIDPKITFKAFEAIFSDNSGQCEPVQWKGSNRLFVYLLNQLVNSNCLDTQEWQSIIEKNKLFMNYKGKYLNANDLSNALFKINEPLIGRNPRGFEKIDEILEILRD